MLRSLSDEFPRLILDFAISTSRDEFAVLETDFALCNSSLIFAARFSTIFSALATTFWTVSPIGVDGGGGGSIDVGGGGGGGSIEVGGGGGGSTHDIGGGVSN